MSLFTKVTSKVMLVIFTLVCLGPTTSALAAGYTSTKCDVSNAQVAGNEDPNCFTRKVAGQKVSYPRVNWVLLGAVDANKDGTSSDFDSMVKLLGSNVQSNNNRSAVLASKKSNETASSTTLFKGSVPILFARYSPAQSILRIDAFKTEKLSTGKIGVYRAIISPYHGDYWKASQGYLTQEEKLSNVGLNPMDRFKGGDEYFHNIAVDGTLVALGHAMRLLNAPVGYMVNAQPRMANWEVDCGSFLRSCTEFHIAGYAKPKWYIATLADFQPNGISARICAEETTDKDANGMGTCPNSKLAFSGVTFMELSGGNMPGWEDELYHWTKKVKGWTVLAQALFMAFVAFVAPMVLGELGLGGLSEGLNMYQKILNEGLKLGLGNGGIAIATGMGHLVFSALAGANPMDMATGGFSLPGTGFSLSTSDGKGSGVTGSMNEHEAALAEQIRIRQTSNLENGSVLSAVDNQFRKVGPYNKSTGKPKDYKEHNVVKHFQNKELPMKSESDAKLDADFIFSD